MTGPTTRTAASGDDAPLRVEGLSLQAGHDALVDRVSLTVRPAEVVAVTGLPGVGKSMLLRALAGLLPPAIHATGSVRAADNRYLVTQDGALTPHRKLADQIVELLGERLGLDSGTALARAVAALERFQVPQAARRLTLHPFELSEPLRWRAVLAMAMAAQPALLLADAPATGLDPTIRARLLDDLAAWARETGTALVMTGRPQDGVAGPATRALTLDHGRLREAVPPDQTPESPPPESPPPESPAASATSRPPPALSVRDLRIAFPLAGGARLLTAVDGVGFELATGESLALLGESGSGKSVLARALLRLVPASGGQVAWMGTDLLAAPPEVLRRARRDLQLLFPDPLGALDPAMTVGAQLAEGLEALRPDLSPTARAARVGEGLREVGLPESLTDRAPTDLPAAVAARVGLARALLTDPRLLVCDEPAATLSGGERDGFLALLAERREARGLTLVVATQDADAGLRLARRALVLLLGRVVETADGGTLASDPRHPYSRALIAAAEGRRPALHGDPPSALRPPSGCALRLRCPRAHDFCAQAVPELETVAPGHRVACHYWDGDGAA